MSSAGPWIGCLAVRRILPSWRNSKRPSLPPISVPTAWRQAKEAGRPLDEELACLLVHGILHLCGYDHERSEKEARRMHRRERMILRSIARLP